MVNNNIYNIYVKESVTGAYLGWAVRARPPPRRTILNLAPPPVRNPEYVIIRNYTRIGFIKLTLSITEMSVS